MAWAYADHAAAKIAKTLERIPAEACLAHDPGAHVLVATAAGDRALPLLPELADADATARFLDRVLPDAPDPGRARIRTVRHNPGRRWVGVRSATRAGPAPARLLVHRADGPGRRLLQGTGPHGGAHPAPGREVALVRRPRGHLDRGDTLGLAAGEDWRAAGTTWPTCTTAPT